MVGIEKSTNTDYNKKINNIFINLDSVISNSQHKDRTVEEHFRFVYKKIKDGDLVVRFDSNLVYDFFGCSSFNVSKGANHDIEMIFGNYIIDKYLKYPYLVYAIVVHTFQYAYDYYNNQSLFMISTENQIESIFFKMDAITIEAMFLKAYSSYNKNLGPFENLIIDDFSNGLPSSSALFLKTDIHLLHEMDALKSKSGTSKSLLDEYMNMGETLIKNFKLENKSEWEKYCALITLRTYVYYSKQVVFDIVYAKDGITQESFNFDRYSDIRTTIDRIINIIELNEELYNVKDKILKAYSDKYKN